MKRTGYLQKVALGAALSALCLGPAVPDEVPIVSSAVSEVGAATFADISQIPLGFSLQILSEGRQVYEDLNDAQAAAQQHNTIDVRLALADTVRDLGALETPSAVRALRAQRKIIQGDLKKSEKLSADDLWVPISAALEHDLIVVPTTTAGQARHVASKKTAAESAEKKSAVQPVDDELMSAVRYDVQVFPLRKVQEDVNSARRSADLPQPYWPGVVEAVRSALTTVHSFSNIQAHGLLKAYYLAADAYSLWPDKPEVIRYLKKTAQELRKTGGSDANVLAEHVEWLVKRNDLQPDELKFLVDDLRQHIQLQRQQTEMNFLGANETAGG
ncbi:MAG: hypothetical protein WA970_15590 [Gammaproteobacteria bacterium]